MLSMLRRFCSLLLAGALSLAVVAFAQDHPGTPEPHWTYSGDTGPAHWGELSSEFSLCKDGKEQSPLNIVRTKTEHIPELQIASHPVPLSLVDNGHTIRQNYAAGNGNTLTVGGKTYELTQFHFHHPSEETIDGKHRDMVVHLVYASKDGNLAVIGVLVKEGKPNSFDHYVVEQSAEREGEGECQRCRGGQRD